MESESKAELEVVSVTTQLPSWSKDKWNLIDRMQSLDPKMEFLSLIRQIVPEELATEEEDALTVFSEIMRLVSSMDLDSQQPKQESEVISLIKQIISIFKSKPDSEEELLSLIEQIMRLDVFVDSDSDSEPEPKQESELLSLIRRLVRFHLDPDSISFIKDIISRLKSFHWEPKPLISLRPQAVVELLQGKFTVMTDDLRQMTMKREECYLESLQFFGSTEKQHFYCRDCKGEDHEEYGKAPIEVKHPLHPKHYLLLVQRSWNTRECYCCNEDIQWLFYYCETCDYAMNIACVQKPPPVLSIDHFKWHEHTLTLFPRHTSLTCEVCALTNSRSPFYLCPPCDFVVHQTCLSLPHVLRISRHPHRISFTPSFVKGDRLCCSICRTKMDNDYGGYSCIKDGCSYAAHSRCATQSNVWDGIDLEGQPEEIEEVVEPFVRITDAVIQHFSHQQHHLRLHENTGKEYDENRLCEACVSPIYFGKFYSCVECDFILHEACANCPRRLYHPIHPHVLTLGTNNHNGGCSACPRYLKVGFFYECNEEGCGSFKLHVQCATISEPLVHPIHTHPLFLTSKPGELGRVCMDCGIRRMKETFNCIEGDCDCALCFGCATIPQKVRYKHDNHMLTLCYGEETSTTTYWCEACETKIKPRGGFYKCDEYCCVTIHIKCLIGKDFYMKPGLSLVSYAGIDVKVLSNNHPMSRPFCSRCENRCPQKLVYQCSGLIFCSTFCAYWYRQ